ncbi:hypothetical protein HFU84_13800 [Acidithiobacillus sp. CV18-2]|uniref:DUF4412 domain-containing protein n=1 Tax=Igneacidithiobacillus copahuensis TaxID=2724909 RepID=A0AAE2YSL7_9PROT|nr:hypothetical protein [Igneacidithiobacillus copahuensis]MBU2755729.1 hypothetical protein [Acidithiobacillus sp. CV18-3]MBU2757072.1 hypothetical protein [Acidithiobacillus sp. BN09-2]MBU2778548.1 hypothetical protein [Acidithiobacillus sp. CV18-2]MBU2797680.1 hypothetical protein [Acidithiobacillus sp. VAN18-2]MBU2798162.1 hypothetical protein [Acidithiobacillus sp. VAN18-4]UTV82261.1 hypothetical protein MQE22_06505 [Acidithiobacillus sp. YTS05]
MQKHTSRAIKATLAVGLAGTLLASGLAVAAPYVLVDGKTVPVHVEQKTMHIPGGVIHIESISYGSGPQAQVAFHSLNTAQAEALMQQNAVQMRQMQVAMEQQMAMMNQMMQVAFAMPGVPMVQAPVPVLFPLFGIPSAPTGVAQAPSPRSQQAQPSGVAPWQQGMYQVHWQKPAAEQDKSSNPKIPL